jgi:hypothetical protein
LFEHVVVLECSPGLCKNQWTAAQNVKSGLQTGSKSSRYPWNRSWINWQLPSFSCWYQCHAGPRTPAKRLIKRWAAWHGNSTARKGWTNYVWSIWSRYNLPVQILLMNFLKITRK